MEDILLMLEENKINNLLEIQIDNIKTKADFIKFIDLLKEDYLENQESWKNQKIDLFLDAMSIWTETMLEKYYVNMEVFDNSKEKLPEHIPWKVFANILMASKIYE